MKFYISLYPVKSWARFELTGEIVLCRDFPQVGTYVSGTIV